MDVEPKFAADRMLGRLARWLRLLGVDVIWHPNLHGHELLRLARKEGRIMLTRDRRLKTAPDVLFIQSQSFRDQLRETFSAYPFKLPAEPLSRCSRCNQVLEEADKETVGRLVPAFVYASQERFAVCPNCGRIYWNGTHAKRILGELATFLCGSKEAQDLEK